MKAVVYFTGPPASGKSTICEALSETMPDLKILSYRDLLLAALTRASAAVSENELRVRSSGIITPELVAATDAELVAQVSNWRQTNPVIIDSHAVTIESYGYRITPFKLSVLRLLKPTHVAMLFCDSESTQTRISLNPQGRSTPTKFQADFHNQLQAQVAVAYALELDLPTYFLDSNRSTSEVVLKLKGMLGSA